MLDRISILRNPVQYYAWGSKTAIPELLGIPNPEGKPMAELWMGAHPKAPSEVLVQHRWVSLIEVVKSSPVSILGKDVAEKFANQLPFLFKILAAEEPLSIQVHPNKEQAKEGFERENRIGIPLDSPVRNYRDDNHKPEMLCALTEFEALKGFRPAEDTIYLLAKLNIPGLASLLKELQRQPDEMGLKKLFSSLMRMDDSHKSDLVSELVERACQFSNEKREFYWIGQLAKKYPGDIGIFSPLLLNLVELRPGQAIFLPAGQLHAYLRGTGLEIMANSDNVLRGGLTTKHVDVDELLRITDFRPERPVVIKPVSTENGEELYVAPAQEFQLSCIEVHGRYVSKEAGPIEILLCLRGKGKVRGGDSKDYIRIDKGQALLVPSSEHPYEVTGELQLWKATVPPS